MTAVSELARCAEACRCARCALARARAACYTATVPYLEPEERPETPLRAHVTGPIAWEDDSLPWHRRLFATLGATFRPIVSLHAVANGELGPALRFACITALPFMLVWAVTPFTHTLMFGPELSLDVVGGAGPLPIWLDVLRAMGIGLALAIIALLAWVIPFASLVRAFADGSRSESPTKAAWRTALYRTWIVPLGTTALYFVSWSMPRQPSPFLLELTLLTFEMVPRLVILIHCHAMARYFGATGFSALVVSIMPLAVQWAVSLPVWQIAETFLPPAPPP